MNMKNRANFRPYRPDQQFLLPQRLDQWLPKDHLVYFVADVVQNLDLSPIYDDYDSAAGGQPAYEPRMMVCLLFYAYCTGVPSSRRIEKLTHESIPFRVLAANQHPDHDTISSFRKRHLEALAGLFVQTLELCSRAGLVKLGHVALDGTKVKANASKHKAMSYERMVKKQDELDAEVRRLLAEAEAVDAEEDARHGRGRRGDELPEELRRKQSRLDKIRQARAAMEAEALAKAQKERAGRDEGAQSPEACKDDAPERRPEEAEPAKPQPTAQRNFTDPESRIMRDGATKSFEQAYNAQAAVDSASQVIVAADLTQEANDKKQLEPMIEQMKSNLHGDKPAKLSADAGYFSEENVQRASAQGIDPYIAAGRQKHGEPVRTPPRGRIPSGATIKERMQRKLHTIKGRCTYRKRKAIVEPVFGQIKQARGFRRFLLRGLEKARAEWRIICLTHNLLKLFSSGRFRTAGA